MLDCRDLRKVYRTDAEEVYALRGVDLQVAAGEFVAIMGASGSGKSTLLQLLGGLDHPTDGRILLDGCEYGKFSAKELTLLRRRRIGFIFQFYNLVPTLTADENIQLPLMLDGRRPDPALYSRLIDQLGLAGRTQHKPGQLSGGQQQRVAIARALMTEPAVVLADEPTGNLDSITAEETLWLLRNSCDQRGQTVVMVTHDPKAAAFADRIITLKDGRIVGEIQMGGADHAGHPLAGLAESL
jgi:putative ABC transport system ATP-binding protein